jgi:hypothetical protein
MNRSRILWTTVVDDVAKRTLTVGGRVAADGRTELLVEDAGWYIRLGNVSFYVGSERPPFDKGDRVRIVIERSDDASQEVKDKL